MIGHITGGNPLGKSSQFGSVIEAHETFLEERCDAIPDPLIQIDSAQLAEKSEEICGYEVLDEFSIPRPLHY